MEKEEVKISVRELVEFILRSGDIDNRRGGWADKESLAKGTRIHKKIQRQMGAAGNSGLWKNRFRYILHRPGVMRRSMQNRISWNRWKYR